MKEFLKVEARDIKRAMAIALDVTERRNSVPILCNVRLRVGKNGLRIIATDLDIEAIIHCDAIDHSDAFDITVNARTLSSIARAAGSSDMRIEKTESGATITIDDGAATYNVPTLPAGDFPSFAWARADEIETFSNGSFVAMLNKVKFCISSEETRYYLNGIAWTIAKDHRVFVATDGHKLAACRYSPDGGDEITRIIPRKAVSVICKHLAGKDVKVFATERPIAIDIAAPGLLIRTKLIDGTFPDWSRVVPTANDKALKVNRQQLATAIAQATAVGSDRIRAVKLAPDGDRLAIEHKSPEFGSGRVATSIAWPKGAKAFGLNHSYFSLMAANCDSEFEIKIDTPVSPILFTDADETMTRVIMPMRV